MITCPHCGTRNDSESARCERCGWLLLDVADDADDRAEPVLPPIPDGGLAEHMPDWLRVPLNAESEPAPGSENQGNDASAAPIIPTAAEFTSEDPIDPRNFLTEADFPAWIRQLAVPPEHRAPSPAAPWDEPWTAAPAQPPTPARRSQPHQAVAVPQPAMRVSRPKQPDQGRAGPVAPPAAPTVHAWGRLAGLLVVLLIVLAIGLVIILASTHSLP